MTLNLFSQNLLLVFALIFAGGVVYAVMAPWIKHLQTPPPKKRKKNAPPRPSFFRTKRPWLVLSGSIALAGVLQLFANWLFTGEQLPSIFFMSMPLALAVGSLVWVWPTRRWHDRVVGGSLVVIGLLFGVLLVNNYYHYYPSLSAAFGLTPRKEITFAKNQITSVRYSRAKPGNQIVSIEQSIQSLSALPPQGQVYALNIPGTVSGFKTRNAWLYAPPVSFTPEKINLPVLVLLAGNPGGPQDWLNGGEATQTLNAFAAQHHGVTPLVVIVDNQGSQFNDTECVDSSRGQAETYLTVDVPTFIKSHFDVSSDPSHWAIGGLSDGGMCGLMLTLAHPSIYHFFLDLGGSTGPSVGSDQQTIAALFAGSKQAWQAHEPLYLLQHENYHAAGLGGYIAVGKSDSLPIVNDAQTIYHNASAAGLDVAYETTDGRHTFAVWAEQFRDSLPWLSYHLGATACVSQCY